MAYNPLCSCQGAVSPGYQGRGAYLYSLIIAHLATFSIKSSKYCLGISVFPAISVQLIFLALMKSPTWAGSARNISAASWTVNRSGQCSNKLIVTSFSGEVTPMWVFRWRWCQIKIFQRCGLRAVFYGGRPHLMQIYSINQCMLASKILYEATCGPSKDKLSNSVQCTVYPRSFYANVSLNIRVTEK